MRKILIISLISVPLFAGIFGSDKGSHNECKRYIKAIDGIIKYTRDDGNALDSQAYLATIGLLYIKRYELCMSGVSETNETNSSVFNL